MLLFTFVYEDDPGDGGKNKIVIDEGVFKRIARDEMDALDELYGITERTMYGFTLSLTKDHQKALDLMQDTYLKILSAAHLYKPMGKPLAWMFTIAKNLHYTNTVKEKRDISMEPEEVSNDKKFSYVTDVDDRIVLEGVLTLLSQEERQIVMLYAISGLKHKEIADALGLNLSTTLSKYHRALKKLRKYLEGKEKEEIKMKQKIKYILPILIIALVVGGYVVAQPVNSLTMDVNPSIEIVTNRLDRVVEINPLNKDAEELLKDFNPKDKNLERTVNDLVDLMILTGHIRGGDDNFVMITVTDELVDSKIVNKVNEAIKAMLQNKQIEATVLNQYIEKSGKGKRNR